MEADAITLQLECHGKATQGTFHSIQATILEATPWGTGLQAHADQQGYRGQSGAVAKAKATAPPKAAGEAGGARRHHLGHTAAGGQRRVGNRHAGWQGGRERGGDEFRCGAEVLDGAIEVRRVPAATRLTAGPTDNDYPAAAHAKDGTVWAVFVAYQRGGEPDKEAAARGEFSTLVPKGNGDQVRLMKFDGRQWSAPMPVAGDPTGCLEAHGHRGR